MGFKYDPDKDTPIFDEHGKRLYSIPTSRTKQIFNADGERLSKRTLKIPQKKGFANKDLARKINKTGRPKGSRNKNTLKDAIKRFESHQLDAAMLIIATMQGDEEKLGGEIKVSDRVSAARYVIEAPNKMKKGFETTETPRPRSEDNTDEGSKEEEPRPLISLTLSDTKDGSS